MLRAYQNHDATLISGYLESFQGDSTLIPDLVTFNRQAIAFSVLTDEELAFHNFGMSYWGDVKLSPFFGVGIVLPQAGVHLIQVDVAGELGIARSFIHGRLSVGVKYRVAFRENIQDFQLAGSGVTRVI